MNELLEHGSEYPAASRFLVEAVERLFLAGNNARASDNIRFGGTNNGSRSDVAKFIGVNPHVSSLKNGGRNVRLQRSRIKSLIKVFDGTYVCYSDKNRKDWCIAILDSWRNHQANLLQEVLTGKLGFHSGLIGYENELSEWMTIAASTLIDNELARDDYKDVSEFYLEDADFLSEPDDYGMAARSYLRGARPTPKTAVHVAVPSSQANDLVRRVTEFPAVLVHGVMGQGTSTLLLQAAHLCLGQGLRVLFLRGGEFESLERQGLVSGVTTVIFVDDAQELRTLPRWATRTSALFRFVFGTRTASRGNVSRLLKRSFDFDTLRVKAPKMAAEIDEFVSTLEKHSAVPDGQTHGETRYLFEEGLEGPTGRSGGLWPAQYQATRGRLLENKFRELIQDCTAEERDVLRAIAFIDYFAEPRQDLLPRPSVALLVRLLANPGLGAIGGETGAVKQISNTRERFDGELYSDHLGPSLVIGYRHTALTIAAARMFFPATLDEDDDAVSAHGLESYVEAYLSAVADTRVDRHRVAFREVLRRLYSLQLANLNSEPSLSKAGENTPIFGEPFLRLKRIATKIFVPELNIGKPDRTYADILEADILLHPKRRSIESDRRYAFEILDSIVVRILEAREDHYSLTHAARVIARKPPPGGERHRVVVAAGDLPLVLSWFDLYERALEISATFGAARRTGVAQQYLRTAAKETDQTFPGERMLGLVEESDLLTDHRSYGRSRISIFSSLVQRAGRFFRRRDGFWDVGIQSTPGLFRECWAEMYRLHDARKHGDDKYVVPSEIESAMDRILSKWSGWLDKAETTWPEGLPALVRTAAAGSRASRKVLIEAWPVFQRTKPPLVPAPPTTTPDEALQLPSDDRTSKLPLREPLARLDQVDVRSALVGSGTRQPLTLMPRSTDKSPLRFSHGRTRSVVVETNRRRPTVEADNYLEGESGVEGEDDFEPGMSEFDDDLGN